MKQNMHEAINELPEPARSLVLAKVQEWQAFAGHLVRLDQQPVPGGKRFVLAFEYGSIGTVLTSSNG